MTKKENQLKQLNSLYAHIERKQDYNKKDISRIHIKELNISVYPATGDVFHGNTYRPGMDIDRRHRCFTCMPCKGG